MAMSVDERVAHVEGRVDGQGQMLTDLSTRLVGLDAKFDLRFAGLETKFDLRFAGLEAKFEKRYDALEAKVDARCNAIEAKFDKRCDAIELKMSANFRWMLGIQFSILVALLASFIAG